MTSQYILPHSKPAEIAVLGAVLLDNEILALVRPLIEPEDFYIPAHSTIFKAMRTLDDNGSPIDLTTLESYLETQNQMGKAGGIEYLVELTSQVPATANAEFYTKIVREKARYRKVISVANKVVSMGYSHEENLDYFDWAGNEFFKATQEDRIQTFSPIKETLSNFFKKLDEATKNPEMGRGVPTGFIDLDKITGGLKKGDLIILAARPSMGKTAFAVNIAENASMTGVPVLIFSLEMGVEQLTTRLLASASMVDLQELGNMMGVGSGSIPKHQLLQQLLKGASKLHKCPIIMDDTPGVSIQTIRARSRQWKSNKEIFPPGEFDKNGLIVIDYMQLMSGKVGKNTNREQEISEISRGLKALAREISVPVLCLSQLNRKSEDREDKKPLLSHLRESGAIEQDADIILFVHRDEYYKRDDPELKGKAEIIIAKHRNGPTGLVNLRFRHKYTKFENATVEEESYDHYENNDDSPF
jgi:replicative DNA helicase